MQDDLMSFHEQRAEIYWWLSTLFAKELTQDDLNAYQSPEIHAFLTALSEAPELKQSISAFQASLAALSLRPDAQLELAADFCGLFLGDPKVGALPYASLYVGETGCLNDKPAQDMKLWMQKYDIVQRHEFNEPSDHLAVELDFMGNLILNIQTRTTQTDQEADLQEQQTFLQTMLLNWIPSFQQSCHQHDPFGFYNAAANVLVAFIQLDNLFLKGE